MSFSKYHTDHRSKSDPPSPPINSIMIFQRFQMKNKQIFLLKNISKVVDRMVT